jgi:radical SAM enzyme (TIGR01210 family)
MSSYPDAAPARDRFVVDRRGAREAHDPWRHQGVIVEDERGEGGEIARVATVFLTGRECPWRCVMCDLWRYTIEDDTPVGAIPAQIAAARRQARDGAGAGAGEGVNAGLVVSAVSVMKLYNAGSFFDPRAVPESDYDDIAVQLVGLERVIVESHPALIGARVDRFLEALARQSARARVHAGTGRGEAPRLEVAMGLETAHPNALERLHKRVTLERFTHAAAELRRRDAALRVFVLISPPFIPADDQDAWLQRSVDFAFECGASVVSLVPTRSGNGAMEALHEDGQFREPTLGDIERSFAAALSRVAPQPLLSHGARRRVFVDLWDLERSAANDDDVGVGEEGKARGFAARRERLRLMNLEQRVLPDIQCASDAIVRAGGGVAS